MIKITLKEYYFSVFSCEIGSFLAIKLFIDEDDLIPKIALIILALLSISAFVMLIRKGGINKRQYNHGERKETKYPEPDAINGKFRNNKEE